MEEDEISLSHFTEFATDNDPPSGLTSDVTPFKDEHLQPAFSTTCECFLMYEGKIVAPHHGGYFININGPCVSCEHDTSNSFDRSLESALSSQTGAVLENGVHRVSSFVTSHAGERHAVHIVHANVRYFATYHHYQSHRYLPIDEVIRYVRCLSPMRQIVTYTAARVTMLRCMNIYHELDMVRDSSWCSTPS
jgi:hypothetical protein